MFSKILTYTGCVHDCRHPWWGGDGECQSDADSAVCACDAGYSTRDSIGHASCVPKRILVTGYLMLAIVSIVGTAHLLWHAYQFRRLSEGAQSARKTIARIRVLLSASVYVGGFGCVGIAMTAKAGAIGYADDGIVQPIYIVFLPSMMFGAAMIAEFWVQTLPAQLLVPGSFAGMLRKASEHSSAFLVVGIANALPISAIGILTIFFAEWPQLAADTVMTAGTITTIGVILFVASRITGVINQALLKGATASSRTFYVKAKKSLWLQALALCGIGSFTLVVTAIKRLTVAGRTTPIFVGTLQVLTGHAAAMIFASATKFDVPSAKRASLPVSSPDVWGTRSSAAPALSKAASGMSRLWRRQKLLPERDDEQSDGRRCSDRKSETQIQQESATVPRKIAKPDEKDNCTPRCSCSAVVPVDDEPEVLGALHAMEETWEIHSLDDVEQQQQELS